MELDISPLPAGPIACHFLHFAKTEDIGLKSALEGKSGVSLITEKNLLFYGGHFNLFFEGGSQQTSPLTKI
jgi:hypothetical protein